jgi:hypothetical protein
MESAAPEPQSDVRAAIWRQGSLLGTCKQGGFHLDNAGAAAASCTQATAVWGPIARLTAGMIFSAISSIERRASRWSIQ